MNRELVAAAFNVPVDELFGRCRTNTMVAIRAAIAAAMYEKGADSHQIAYELERDRTTILYLLGRTTSSYGLEYKPPADWDALLATARRCVQCQPSQSTRRLTIYSQTV